MPPDGAAGVWGELIVQSGRQAGKGQALSAPLILIGRSGSCDIRLQSNAVAPLHCALVFTPTGVVLRKLQARDGTSINGAPAGSRPLKDGDLIAVGPFEFRLRLIASALARIAPVEATIDDAVRIQAAAVVAQQAALTDEEIRLQQRKVALERQETQLASHLEEKRRRLIELRNQTRDARQAVKSERTRQQKELAAAAEELATLRAEVQAGQQQIHDERVRLVQLRQKLRQRLHRHWMAERATLKRREQALAAERAEQEKTRERLHRERQEIYRIRLQLNGEAELNKRRVREAWDHLNAERCRWEEQRAHLQGEVKARTRELEQRAIDLTDTERNLTEERRRWEESRLALEKEAEGLEARIRNQRRKLVEQEEELRNARPADAAEQVPSAAPSSPSDAGSSQEIEKAVEARLAELDRLAEDLGDHRLYLTEQCERLNLARKQWQEQRDATASELESFATQVQQREIDVGERERKVGELEATLGRHQRELQQQQQALDAWQARLTVRTTLWEGDRERLLAEIQNREDKAERMVAAIADIRRRWQQRRTEEVERLQVVLAMCDQLRRDCAVMRDDWIRRGKVLERERKALAERALALEEYRFTFVRDNEDRAIVEQRLEKMRRRWVKEFESAEEPLLRERKNLARAAQAIQDRYAKVRDDLEALSQREAELTRRQTDTDQQHLKEQSERDQMRGEADRLRARSAIYQRQLQEINNEVERLARALLEEGDSDTPLARAA